MTVRVTASDPPVTVDPTAIEMDLAVFLKAQGITTDAGWDTFLNNMTTLNALLAFTRAVWKRMVKIG